MPYESETIGRQGSNSVGQCADSKNAEIHRSDDEIPDEVTKGKCLYQSSSTRVSPHAAIYVHLHALLVSEHDPQSQDVDEDALEEGDDMSVPVDLLLPRQLRIMLGSQRRRDDGRADVEQEEVEARGKDDLMDVSRQCQKVQSLRHGADELRQPWAGWQREGILHREMLRPSPVDAGEEKAKQKWIGCERQGDGLMLYKRSMSTRAHSGTHTHAHGTDPKHQKPTGRGGVVGPA